ncbi:MAG: hypothetical protein WC942_10820 [Clostridia bacterium]|jgi:hypothetical protein
MESNVFVLCPIFDDNYDLNGNYFKEDDIEDNNFSQDRNLENGIIGYLNGESSFEIYKNIYSGKWALLHTTVNEDLICINYMQNLYKFRKGYILHIGLLEEIISFLPNNDRTIGTELWKKRIKEENNLIGFKR